MYFICKFSDTWTLYEKENDSSRLLNSAEVGHLSSLFPELFGHGANILEALQISSISLSKLQQTTADLVSDGKPRKTSAGAQYFVCKVANTWTLYDQKKRNSRLISAPEIDFLKSMFSSLLGQGANIVEALLVSTIAFSKLQQLAMPARPSDDLKKIPLTTQKT